LIRQRIKGFRSKSITVPLRRQNFEEKEEGLKGIKFINPGAERDMRRLGRLRVHQ